MQASRCTRTLLAVKEQAHSVAVIYEGQEQQNENTALLWYLFSLLSHQGAKFVIYLLLIKNMYESAYTLDCYLRLFKGPLQTYSFPSHFKQANTLLSFEVWTS